MKILKTPLLFAMALILGGMFGIQNQAHAQGDGFIVSTPTLSESEGNSIIIWKVEQTTSQTGLSHFNIQNFCLPVGANILVENSSDLVNWSIIPSTTEDGSTSSCQTFGSFLKFSGAMNTKINYYRLTLKGKYTLVDGFSIIKFGNGQGRPLEASCRVIATLVPKLAATSMEAVTKQACEGGSLELKAASGYSNYSWSVNSINLNTSTDTYQISNAQPGTYNYEVSYQVSNCESIVENFTVVVPTKPSISLQAASFCASGSTSLVDLITSPNKEGVWTISSGTATISDGKLWSSTAGDVTLKYTLSYGEGCSTSSEVKVTVNPLPTVSANANQAVCYDAPVTLTGSGALTYIWDNSVLNGVAFKAIETKTYTVTGTDANGCVNTATTLVTVNALPIVIATAAQTVCYDTEITLNGSGAVTYVWDNSVLNGVAFKANETKTYTVTGTDAHGCVNTATTLVTVNTLPRVIANASSTEVCDGTNVTLYGSGASLYTWDKNVVNNVEFKQAVGSITYTVKGIDLNSCENTNSITIKVKELPSIVLTENQAICMGESVTIKASGNATSYRWNPGNAVDAEINVNPSMTTTYTVFGTLDGCTSSAASIVTVKERPKVDLKVDNALVCTGTLVTLVASSSVGATFKWSNTDATTALIQDYPTQSKTYVVVAYLDGCESSNKASMTVTVTDCKLNATYTQGFYGNAGGLACDGMTTMAKLKTALSDGAFTFGGNNNRSFTLRATDITNGNLFKMLPGGGTPAALSPGTWNYDSKGMRNAPLDAKGKITNNLLSQTITLWLNIRTSSNLGGFIMSSTFKTAKANCRDNVINYADTKEFKVGAKLTNKTVNDLFNLAIKALTNSLDKGTDPDLSEIFTTVDLINNAFDQGRYAMSTPMVNTVEVKMMSRVMSPSNDVLEVIKAFPNPFSGTLNFTLTPRFDGHGSLDLYTLSGQKVATVFEGDLKAGVEKNIQFTMPTNQISQTLIFHFRQGTEMVQGKLISL